MVLIIVELYEIYLGNNLSKIKILPRTPGVVGNRWSTTI